MDGSHSEGLALQTYINNNKVLETTKRRRRIRTKQAKRRVCVSTDYHRKWKPSGRDKWFELVLVYTAPRMRGHKKQECKEVGVFVQHESTALLTEQNDETECDASTYTITMIQANKSLPDASRKLNIKYNASTATTILFGEVYRNSSVSST
jgi:hypothetical protein